MKKIVLLSLFIIANLAYVGAQATPSIGSWTNSTLHAKTTSTNADTAICQVNLPGFNNYVAFEVKIAKLTGTAAGKVYLFGNLNGTNPLLEGQFNNKNPDILDSLTLTDISVNKKCFDITGSKRYYYFVIYKPSGTQTSTPTLRYIARKEFGQ